MVIHVTQALLLLTRIAHTLTHGMITVTQISLVVKYIVVPVTQILFSMSKNYYSDIDHVCFFNTHSHASDTIIADMQILQLCIKNNDMGYRTRIAKLGMQMMTLLNDNLHFISKEI